jgi:hypothetical protein
MANVAPCGSKDVPMQISMGVHFARMTLLFGGQPTAKDVPVESASM